MDYNMNKMIDCIVPYHFWLKGYESSLTLTFLKRFIYSNRTQNHDHVFESLNQDLLKI